MRHPDAATPAIHGPLFDTRRAAHEAVQPTLRERQQAVLAALRRRGNATADELCADLGLTRNSVAPRLCELEKLGAVRRLATTRPTPTGAHARVYQVIQ